MCSSSIPAVLLTRRAPSHTGHCKNWLRPSAAARFCSLPVVSPNAIGQEVRQAVPGVDGILGTREWANIVPCVEQLLGLELGAMVRPPGVVSVVSPMSRQPCQERRAEYRKRGMEYQRRQAREPSAYLKIADGCSAPCAFCAIPTIKGPQRSKPRNAILEEARQLVAREPRRSSSSPRIPPPMAVTWEKAMACPL